MKRPFIWLCFLMLFSPAVKAQEKPVELFDLIKIFTPESVPETDNYSICGDWKAGSGANAPLKWITNGIEMTETAFIRKGLALVAINGEMPTCLETTSRPCKWNISLEGPRCGYMEFHISLGNNQEVDPGKYIDATIGKIADHMLYGKDKEGAASFGFRMYQVNISGKRKIWLNFQWSCGSAGCSLDITGYLNKEDADKSLAKR